MNRAIRCALLLASGYVGSGFVCAPARAQAAAQKQGAPEAKKLANPLNDLLEEAQRDISRNDYQAALEPLQKFIAEKPDFAYAHFQLGYAYTALQRWEEARAEYRRAINLDPKLAEPQLNLGILMLDREPAEADAAQRKADELVASLSLPRHFLARELGHAGDADGALGALERARAPD